MKVLLERFNRRERLTLSVGGTISGSTRKIKKRTELSSKAAVFQHLFLFASSFKTHVSGYCCFCCCPFPAMVVCSLNLLAQLSFPSLWCFCQIIWRHNKNSSVLSNGEWYRSKTSVYSDFFHCYKHPIRVNFMNKGFILAYN